jgi:hypothetical protein
MQGSTTSLSQRAMAVAAVDALASTLPILRACLEAGVAYASYYRWKSEIEAATSGALTQPVEEIKKGRPALFVLTPGETRRLRFWRLVKGSIPLAVEAAIAESTTGNESPYFSAVRAMQADGDVVNPDHRKTRQSIEGATKLDESKALALRGYWQRFVEARKAVCWPMSIRRACRVSEDEEAAFRGRKALESRAGHERRGAFIIDEEGKRMPWCAGAIWCSDDMSVNDPFRFYDAAENRELVGRQTLWTTDAFSLDFLGCHHIGRDRDSYRAEDIARHFAALVDEHGLPLVWRVERGRWDNNFINGCPLPGEFEEDGTAKRWGGLDAIIHMAVKFNSRGKEIEGCFNLLQAMMDHGGDGRTLSIGRQRGEFEQATKLMLRTDRDLAALEKFWSIEASADHAARVMQAWRERPKVRESMGNQSFTPAELWSQHVKRPCPQNERWRFLPVKTPARIWKGVLEIKVNHYPVSFRFRVHGAGRMNSAHFVDGHEVMVAFDPSEAWAGCHVFNRDRSARNRDGWNWLERIGVADHMADVPQEDLRGEGYSPGQTRAKAQVRTEYRSTFSGTHFTGRRRSHAQDGLGNALAVQRGVELSGESPPSQARSTEPVRGGMHEGRLTPRHATTLGADDFDEAEELHALTSR